MGSDPERYGVAYGSQYVIPDFIFDTPEQAEKLLAYFRPHFAEPDAWRVVRVTFEQEDK